MRLFSIFLLLISLSFSLNISEFFSRSGYVVKKEDNIVIIDLGKGKTFKGEIFKVVGKGEPLIHPITKKVIGYRESILGKIKVKKVYDTYSEALILVDKGIKEGDRIKLHYEEVCYKGSKEGFFKLSGKVENLKYGEDCEYIITELESGFGVSFQGKPIAFFEEKVRKVVKRGFEGYVLKAKFIKALEDIPLGADVCKLFGNRDYLLVLFEEKLKIYEILKNDFVEVFSYNLPSGEPIGVECYKKENKTLVFVNMLVDGSANSVILKPVGGEIILMAKNVPYIFGVLEGEIYGQEFSSDDFWGRTYKFKFEREKLIAEKAVEFPEGFRIDGAEKFKNMLIFTDGDRKLKVYVNGEEVLSEEGFGVSYTAAHIPEVHEEESRYVFYVKPLFVKIDESIVPLIPKNKTSGIFEALGFTKFIEAEIWTINKKTERVYDLVRIKGREFSEAIQSIVKDSKGRIFVITATKGTLPIQNKGEIFKVEITPY